MIQMQKLVDKNCKPAVIIMVMDTKENMLVIKKKKKEISKEKWKQSERAKWKF